MIISVCSRVYYNVYYYVIIVGILFLNLGFLLYGFVFIFGRYFMFLVVVIKCCFIYICYENCLVEFFFLCSYSSSLKFYC